MSVILAFGLSPLGQVPAQAYAKDGGEITAQAIETQATSATYTVTVDEDLLVYNGTPYASASTSTDAAVLTNLAGTGKALHVWKLTTDSGTNKEDEVAAGDIKVGSDFSSVKWQQKVNGEWADLDLYTQDSTDVIQDAGTYRLILKTTGASSSEVTKEFTIAPFDLSKKGVQFTDDYVGGVVDLTYTGKWQTFNVVGGEIVTATSTVPAHWAKKNTNGVKVQEGTGGTPIVLTAAGYDIMCGETSTVLTRGYHDVTLVGKGNFKGSIDLPYGVTVGQGQFNAPGGATVNGVANAPSADELETAKDAAGTAISNGTGTDAGAATTFAATYGVTTGTVTMSELKADWDTYADGEADDQYSISDTALTEAKAVYAAVLASFNTVGSEVNLGTAKKNPTLADPDPAAQGKVMFGDQVLTRGADGDYTVKYYTNSQDMADDANGSTTAPTAQGDYYCTITVQGTNFNPAADKTKINVTYSVAGAALNEIADSVSFGDAAYVAPDDTYTSIAPSTVTFKKDGSDVTATIGENYELTSVVAWTAKDEKELIGEAAYEAKYKYEDEEYTNPYAVASATAESFRNANNDAPVKTFRGLTAGDYKLTVTGLGEVNGGTLTGKFTVLPNTPAVGTSVGQIKVTPGKAALNQAPGQVAELALAMVTDTSKKGDAKSVALTQADPNDVGVLKGTVAMASGTKLDKPYKDAVWTVKYKKDGKYVKKFTESGTYDAVFTFGPNYGFKTLEVADALTVDKADAFEDVDYAYVDNSGKYYYTGQAIDPKVVFVSMADDKEDAFDTAVADEALVVYKALPGNSSKTQTNFDAESAEDKAAWTAQAKYNVLTAAGAGTTYGLTTKTVKKDAYSFASTGTGSLVSTSGGKPVGVGEYSFVLNGTGDYTGKISVLGSLEVERLNLDNHKTVPTDKSVTPDGNTDPYQPFTTVLYKDGDEWVEDYSVIASEAAEPQFIVVPVDKKNEENPQAYAIPSTLYTYEVTIPTGADGNNGRGEADLKITGKDSYLVTDDSFTYHFYVADKTFAEAGIDKVTLDKDSVKYKLNESKQGTEQTPTVNLLLPSGQPLTQQGATGTGDYVVTIKDPAGKTVYRSTQADNDGVVDAGVYTVTVSGGNSTMYAGTISATYEVKPLEVKETDAKLAIALYEGAQRPDSTKDELTYSGEEQDWVKAVAYDTDIAFEEIEAGDDAFGKNAYVVTGDGNTDAGSYTATVELQGNFTGTFERAYKINPVKITGWALLVGDKQLVDEQYGTEAGGVTVTDLYTVSYNSKAQEPKVTLVDANGNEYDDIDLTYIYANNTDATINPATNVSGAGAAVTVIPSSANYTGRATGFFEIEGYDLGSDRLAVSLKNDDLSYTGKAVEPKGTLTYTAKDGTVFDLVYGKDYAVEYSGDNVNPGGVAYAKFYGLAPNFVEGRTAKTVEFTVEAAQPKDQEITANVAKVAPVFNKTKAITVSGAQGAIKATVTNGTGKATATVSGNKVTVKGAKAGSATLKITAEATENYKASNEIVIPVTVAKAANTLKVAKVTRTAKGVSKAKKVVAGLKLSNKGQGTVTYKKVKVNKNAKKFTVNKKTGKITIAKGTKAGTYKVTVSAKAAGNGNYKASALKKAVVTVKVKK